jgi:hypothetical protein
LASEVRAVKISVTASNKSLGSRIDRSLVGICRREDRLRFAASGDFAFEVLQDFLDTATIRTSRRGS